MNEYNYIQNKLYNAGFFLGGGGLLPMICLVIYDFVGFFLFVLLALCLMNVTTKFVLLTLDDSLALLFSLPL